MSQSNTIKLHKRSNIELALNLISGATGVGIGIIVASFLGWF